MRYPRDPCCYLITPETCTPYAHRAPVPVPVPVLGSSWLVSMISISPRVAECPTTGFNGFNGFGST